MLSFVLKQRGSSLYYDCSMWIWRECIPCCYWVLYKYESNPLSWSCCSVFLYSSWVLLAYLSILLREFEVVQYNYGFISFWILSILLYRFWNSVAYLGLFCLLGGLTLLIVCNIPAYYFSFLLIRVCMPHLFPSFYLLCT